MMYRSIKKLDKSVANKIAAGEVVERPASVIKELLENSIDAGSNQITIEIREAGKELIRVTDNGHGINKDEISLAFERHATSKIYTDDEIYNIKSLGFRGEALASISSVSKVEIITKQADSDFGVKAELLQGKIVHDSSVGCPKGTTIMVKDLLYNTPARLKFLKSNTTELSHINSIVNNIALSHPDIAFKYIVNDRNVFSTKGDNNILNCIFTIFGKDIAKGLVPVNAEYNNIKISGFISKIQNTRGNRQLETVFINRRYVKSRVMSMSIEAGYKTLIPSGRFPICFLYMDIPPRLVDVNIHPAKTEIKFRDEISIKNFIRETVSDVLLSNNIVPSFDIKVTTSASSNVDLSTGEILDAKETREEDRAQTALTYNKEANKDVTKDISNTPPLSDFKPNATKSYIKDNDIPKKETITEKEESTDPISKVEDQIAMALIKRKDDFIKITEDDIESVNKVNDAISSYTETNHSKTDSKMTSFKSSTSAVSKPEKKINTILDELRIIGQIFSSYILCEANEKLYVIDQHAAHERILYEKFLQSFRESDIMSQILLEPISIDLNYQDISTIMANKSIFRKLGYKIEEFGYNTIILREVPILFGTPVAKSFFMEIIDNLDDFKSTYDYKIEKIISKSCKTAIKASDRLDYKEIDRLIMDMKSTNNPFTCPHGRPTIISMTRKELEKKFLRT